MSKNYTPTTDTVRHRYTEFPYVADIEDEPADPAEFDRWLAIHDAKVQADVIEWIEAMGHGGSVYREARKHFGLKVGR
jgi:hypothetical protein